MSELGEQPTGEAATPSRRRLGVRRPGWLRPDPIHGLGGVLLFAAVCMDYRLRSPNAPVIFDETFYVNAARIILGRHVPGGLPYSGEHPGLDPNPEHPPLGKLLIAASMWIFGDNGFGWRLPSVLAGVASIALVYAIVRLVSPDGWLAVLAAAIFAMDNLVLTQSRMATLDMPYVAFLLLAVYFWMRHWHVAAGAACGISALIKESALFGFGALLLLGLGTVAWQRVRDRTWNRQALLGSGLLVLSFVCVSLGGLWILDLAFTPYNTPWSHLKAIHDYGFLLRNPHGPTHGESRPWSWLVNEIKEPYFRVVVNVTVDHTVVSTHRKIDFEGAMNPMFIGAAPFGISYAVWRAWRLRDVLSIWVLVWVAATYLVYYPIVLITWRTTYFFYILPALPAVAVAIAQFLRQPQLPRVVTWGYLASLLVGLAFYYPFRDIL